MAPRTKFHTEKAISVGNSGEGKHFNRQKPRAESDSVILLRLGILFTYSTAGKSLNPASIGEVLMGFCSQVKEVWTRKWSDGLVRCQQ